MEASSELPHGGRGGRRGGRLGRTRLLRLGRHLRHLDLDNLEVLTRSACRAVAPIFALAVAAWGPGRQARQQGGYHAQKTARLPCGGVAAPWAQDLQRDRGGANSPLARREDGAALLEGDACRRCAGRRPGPLASGKVTVRL